MGLPKLILRTVNKYLKGLEKRCQSLVTVTVTFMKRKINCMVSLISNDCKKTSKTLWQSSLSEIFNINNPCNMKFPERIEIRQSEIFKLIRSQHIFRSANRNNSSLIYKIIIVLKNSRAF
jgi:hypothetical protein